MRYSPNIPKKHRTTKDIRIKFYSTTNMPMLMNRIESCRLLEEEKSGGQVSERGLETQMYEQHRKIYSGEQKINERFKNKGDLKSPKQAAMTNL